MTGTLFLVGVGPGDPELLTLKAARRIAAAPVVAFLVTESGAARARDIAAAEIAPHAILEPVRIDMMARNAAGDIAGKDTAYAAAANRLASHLAAGRDVAFLCEGDPLFYGSAIYLGALLRSRFALQVVPGITSMLAGAAAVPTPLVAKDARLTVLTGTAPDAELRPALAAPGAIALLKVGRHFDRLAALLTETGRGGRTTLLENLGGADERIVPLAEAGPGPKPYFSLLLCPAAPEPWQPGARQ